MKHFFEKYLKIYVHELSRFVWIAAIFFVIFFVTAIFRNYVDAAFIKRYGTDAIPLMLAINSILTFIVIGISGRLAARFPDHVLLTGMLVIYSISVTIAFFMVRADVNIVYPILYQLLYLLDSLLLVYLWNIAGDLFDARQGKRIFPLITAAQVLGATIGSFSTKPLTVALGEDPALLIFGIVCLFTAVHLARTGVRMVARPTTKSGSAKRESATKKLTEIPKLMGEYPIIRYLIITGLIPNILLPIFFYQFSVIANQTFTSEASLLSFLSVFRGMTTLVTFVLLFFVGRLYSKMGLTNASMVHPLNFTVLFGSLTTFFNVYVACYGQFSVILIQRAIAGPVNKVLYSVIPENLAIWSRTFIRGTVLKIGTLAGSLLLLSGKQMLTPKTFSYVALVFAVYWVIETLLFRKHYKRMLKQVIVEKQIDFDRIDSVRTFDSGSGAMEMGPLSVEVRDEEAPDNGREPSAELHPDTALKLLDDQDPMTRAEAAASFKITQDNRAVRKLLRLLEDPDDRPRYAAMEALMAYGDTVVPYLEMALVGASPRVKQGILEVIRLAEVKDFEMVPFLGRELTTAYDHLVVINRLKGMQESDSVRMLSEYLQATYDDTLRLIFYALWVNHADMRLMYEALRSEASSIAVEMVENSIDREVVPFLIPLIEDVPLSEKIEKGRRILPVVRHDNMRRLLTYLVESDDPLACMLSLYFIAEQQPEPAFIPVIESRFEDDNFDIAQTAAYARAKVLGEEAEMPDIMDTINRLKLFTIFEGMGIRELYAIASVVTVEHFKPKELLIKEGEDNTSIYLVVSGKVSIYQNYGAPEEMHKATIGEGSFLGELSMFTKLPPNATCISEEQTEVFVLRHHQFLEIMKFYPQIGINLCAFFSLNCRRAIY